MVQELERTALRNANAEEVFTAIRRAVAEHHELQVGAIGLLKTNAMPKTSSGKIQRHLCRSGFLDGQLSLVHSWQAESAVAEETTAAESELEYSGSNTHTEPTRAGGFPHGQTLTLERPATRVKTTPQADTLATPKAIEQWMVNWLSASLKVPVQSLDVHKPFAEHGLDSLTTVELAEALEQSLGVPLAPTLAYEYPTIEALSVYLAAAKEQGHREEPVAQIDPREDAEVDQLVRELKRLSDAEIQELLGTESIEWS